MSWKTFTQEELLELRSNPYVKSITPKMIRFTTEFKEIFWELYKKGTSPTSIMFKLGFDPEVLGESRINGIMQHIKEAADSGEGFRESRKSNTLVENIGGLSPSKALIRMQHELIYMKQELEFIKKIILADRKPKRK